MRAAVEPAECAIDECGNEAAPGSPYCWPHRDPDQRRVKLAPRCCDTMDRRYSALKREIRQNDAERRRLRAEVEWMGTLLREPQCLLPECDCARARNAGE